MGRPPVPSGFDCFHCGSDTTCKAGMSKGKLRFRCRSCKRFFIDPRERIIRPEPKPTPQSTAYRRGPAPKKLPSAGHLVLKLRSIAFNLGRPPTTAEIIRLAKEGRSYPLDDYYKVFGSYVQALKKARLKSRYRQEFDEHDRSRMLNELRALSRRLKRPLYGRDFPAARKKGLVSPISHFHIAFGTVPNAIALAGVGPKISYTRDEMIAILRKLDAKLDRPVEGKDIRELNRAGKGPSVNVIARMFGSLAKARVAAGVQTSYKNSQRPTTHWQKYTKKQLVLQLQALAKQLGRRPTDRDLNKASKEGRCAASPTFSRMFGSLPEAYRAAGFNEVAKNQRRHTDKEILAALLNLKKQLGHFPGFHDITAASKAGTCPSNNTIARRLGSLTELKKKYGE